MIIVYNEMLLYNIFEMKNMLVKDIMTKNVYTVLPQDSLKKASDILKEKKISGIPVVDENGVVVGIITITDLLKILGQIYEWKELEKKESEVDLSHTYEEQKEKGKVEDIMTKEVVTLEEDDTIDDVMSLMFERKIHTIPIIKEGKLIGVVGKRDLIHACF